MPAKNSTNSEPKQPRLPASLTIDDILAAVEADDNLGFCLSCGEQADCVEPDARKYTCESCDMPQVYGAEELLMMFGG